MNKKPFNTLKVNKSANVSAKYIPLFNFSFAQ